MEFDGRIVSFGAYDFNGPNDTTYLAMVSGKSNEDHMILYDELQNSMTSKLLSVRGEKWKA